MDRLTALLDPTKRKALYALLLAAGGILVIFNFAPQVTVVNWVEVLVQAVGVVGIVIMAIKTKRFDFKAIYAAAAGLVAALTVAGVLNDGQSSQAYDTMAQLGVAFAAYQAFVRTNTTVPTGQPIEEVYAARHGADRLRNEVGQVRVDDAGQASNGLLLTIVLVLVGIAAVIFIVNAV